MSYMQAMDVTEILESMNKHFRRNVEKEFGDILQFEDLIYNNKLCTSQKSFKGLIGKTGSEIIWNYLRIRNQK